MNAMLVWVCLIFAAPTVRDQMPGVIVFSRRADCEEMVARYARSTGAHASCEETLVIARLPR